MLGLPRAMEKDQKPKAVTGARVLTVTLSILQPQLWHLPLGSSNDQSKKAQQVKAAPEPNQIHQTARHHLKWWIWKNRQWGKRRFLQQSATRNRCKSAKSLIRAKRATQRAPGPATRARSGAPRRPRTAPGEAVAAAAACPPRRRRRRRPKGARPGGSTCSGGGGAGSPAAAAAAGSPAAAAAARAAPQAGSTSSRWSRRSARQAATAARSATTTDFVGWLFEYSRAFSVTSKAPRLVAIESILCSLLISPALKEAAKLSAPCVSVATTMTSFQPSFCSPW
mmetsp:Transcript_44787/g.74449  ORF Transcript_44787/g.74449 Transcript_44787/m.74449 type:complete len:281 (+) Transcript_44787:480-1322(+)